MIEYQKELNEFYSKKSAMDKQLKKMGQKKGGKLEPMLYNVGPAKSQ